MPRYAAARLLEVRRSMSEPPDEQTLRALLDGLLGALETFHRAAGFHGKVTPSNILLLADNRPLLLGPGAAGRAISGDRIDALMNSGEPCFAPIEQMVESADNPLHPSVDFYALAGVARYWISGELPAPTFSAPRARRREKLADTVQRLRLTWPRLHYSASLLDTLDSALSIYPAERPPSVAQMRARLGTAAPAADGAVIAPAAAVVDPVPSPPAPSPQPGTPDLQPATAEPVAQDLPPLVALSPEPGPIADPGIARVDDDSSPRPTFVRHTPKRRRIATWGSVALLLAVLLFIGTSEFDLERQARRVLDVLGNSAVTAPGDNAGESAPAVTSGGPATPPVAADAGGAIPAEAQTTASDSSSSTAPSPASAPIAADAETAKPVPTEPAAAEPAPSATAPSPVASPPATTPAAVAPAPPERTAIAQPSHAVATPATRSAQQHVSRTPASPREACGARTQFSLYRCMKTQCSQHRWASHAQCQRLRRTDSVD